LVELPDINRLENYLFIIGIIVDTGRMGEEVMYGDFMFLSQGTIPNIGIEVIRQGKLPFFDQLKDGQSSECFGY